jgi:hypothetical protein
MLDEWYERYGQRGRDWRLPKAETARATLAVTVGTAGSALLEVVYGSNAPAWLWQVPAVQSLRAVWVQQYHRDQDGLRWRDKTELPPGALAIGSPYDPQARYGIKRGVGWLGYKAHFTETCEPDRPHLIVHVATTVAAANDVDTVAARHAGLAAADLLPAEHLVDAGYVSVDHVLDARADHGVELVGPLPPDSGWQARDEAGFDLTRFQIDWDTEQVICPNGKTGRNWRQTSSRNGLPIIQATFCIPDCTPTLTGPAAPARRSWPAISPSDPAPSTRPSNNSAPSRPPDARRERYAPPRRHRGHHRPGRPPRRPPPGPPPRPGHDPPTAALTALALNLVRLDAWLSGTPPGGTWASPLTRLPAAPSPV